MKRTVIFLLLILIVLNNVYSANTSLRISSFTRNINLNYDLSGGAEIVQTLTVKHKGDALEYFVTFAYGQSGQWSNRIITNGGTSLNYQIYRDNTKIDILKDLADSPSSNEVIRGSFAQSGSFQFTTISYTVYIPAEQFDLAGIYSDTFDVTLYSGNLSSYIQKNSKTHSLKVTMPASLELSMTQSGNPFNDAATAVNMNFGVLYAGSVRSAEAIVRTNSPYSVLIFSDNQGNLMHSDSTVSDKVPYTLSFNGTLADLRGSTPSQIISGASVTPWEGTRYPLEVTIEDFGMASEGSYSDSITITIQAQ